MAKKLDPKVAEAVMLKAGLKPLEPYKGSKEPWKSIHIECGEVVRPSYGSVAMGNGGCRNCGNLKSTLATMTPENIAQEIMIEAGLKPLEPFKGVSKKWKCIHLACGEIVYPRYADVNSGKGGCNPCAKRNSLNYKRIPEKQAVALMLKNNMKPLEPFVDTTKKWKSRCTNKN